MAKSASLRANIKALEAFSRHGLFIQAGHILFDHETTLAELRENLKGMRRFSWTLSKGIFTEMFAAKGTAFTRLLAKRNLFEGGAEGSMNTAYAVRDPEARAVHGALKAWQKSHSGIYDMAVDVLGAPKAVAMEDFRRFHILCGELRARDLDLFGLLLNVVEEPGGGSRAADFVQAEIEASRGWYATFHSRLEAAYRAANLIYDADENPFLC
jgi:anaerobic magnesium-protoporphyrin IX monomethyl ester cyclase